MEKIIRKKYYYNEFQQIGADYESQTEIENYDQRMGHGPVTGYSGRE